MYPEQQRYWVSLLNLQRTWTDDATALSFLPPRYRDFTSGAEWAERRALTFLLNNLDLVRESWRRVEAGEQLDYDLLNAGVGALTLRIQPWRSVGEIKSASRAKVDLGGRLETLQVTTSHENLNPGTKYIRATVERALYYFAQYVDARFADPAYPSVTPGRYSAVSSSDGSGDLVLERAGEDSTT